MSVAYYLRYPKTNRPAVEVSNEINDRLIRVLGGRPPEGAIFHAEGPLPGDGWWIFDVWTSDDAFAAFQKLLQPVLAEAGVGRPEVERLEVHFDSSQPPAAAGR